MHALFQTIGKTHMYLRPKHFQLVSSIGPKIKADFEILGGLCNILNPFHVIKKYIFHCKNITYIYIYIYIMNKKSTNKAQKYLMNFIKIRMSLTKNQPSHQPLLAILYE